MHEVISIPACEFACLLYESGHSEYKRRPVKACEYQLLQVGMTVIARKLVQEEAPQAAKRKEKA